MSSAFEGAGAQELQVWRVEQLKPVNQTPTSFGKFYSGDSYLVLHTTKDPSKGKVQTVHFWQGSETSQDEAGASAILAMELDDFLGGAAKQCRQVQGEETPEFLQLFKNSVTYLQGGVASGFHHVETAPDRIILLEIKGRKGARAREVPVSADSLNSGNCYVLDAGRRLFIWTGSGASRAERSTALDVAATLRENRQSIPEVAVVEEGKHRNKDAKEFFSLLGVTDPSSLTIRSVEAGGDDDAVDSKLLAAPMLFRSMLQPSGIFLLASGPVLHVWVGSEAPSEARRGALQAAQAQLGALDMPSNAPIKLNKQGFEDAAFKQNFRGWLEQEHSAAVKNAKQTAAKPGGKAVDAAALVNGSTGQGRQHNLVLDGVKGSIKVWRLENMEKVEWEQSRHGHFFEADSYLVLYSYKAKDGSPAGVIYLWQGRESSMDEKAAAAVLAIKLDESECGGKAVQVCVEQGQEPAHFVALFDDCLVVHRGGKATGWNNSTEQDSATNDPSQAALFHVRGTQHAAYAVQVDAKAASLNSGDCFVLVAGGEVLEWHGKASTPDERAAAASVASRVAPPGAKRQTVSEGSEPFNMWVALGGQEAYPAFGEAGAPAPPSRLFLVSDRLPGGMQEIHNFEQDDLADENTFILDAFYMVFVWLGADVSDAEKSLVTDIAPKYIQAAAAVDGRNSGQVVTVVESGREPALFCAQFHAWNPDGKKALVETYEAKLKALKEKAAMPTASAAANGGLVRPKLRPTNAGIYDTASSTPPPSSNRGPTAAKAASTTPAPATPLVQLRKTAAAAPATPVAAGNGSPADGAPGELAAGGMPSDRPAGADGAPEAAGQGKPIPKKLPAERLGTLGGPASGGASLENGKELPQPARKAPIRGRLERAGQSLGTSAAPATSDSAFRRRSFGAMDFPLSQDLPPPKAPANLKFQPGEHFFPRNELKGMNLDSGIDPVRKEDYLTDEEFQTVFKQDREKFKALPMWRRQLLKKSVGLF